MLLKLFWLIGFFSPAFSFTHVSPRQPFPFKFLIKNAQNLLSIPGDTKQELALNLLKEDSEAEDLWYPNIRLVKVRSESGIKQVLVNTKTKESPFPSFLQIQSNKNKDLDLKSFYSQYTQEKDSFGQFQDLGCQCKFLKTTLQDSLKEDFETGVAYKTQIPEPEYSPFSSFSVSLAW